MPLRGRANLTEEYLYFVTTTVVKFTEVFTNDIYCDILIDNIKYYQKKYKFDIIGYVIMPSHFHWIVLVHPKIGNISSIMRDIKKYSAWDLMDEIERNNPNLINIFYNEAVKFRNSKRKFWMERFDDVVIRNEKMFWTKLKYIHRNPVEAGLVKKPEDYEYSSAKNYVGGENIKLEIDTSFAGIEIR